MTARHTAALFAVLFLLPTDALAAPARPAAPAVSAKSPLLGPLRVLAAFGTATSTWRSVRHNRRIGGVPNSYHLIGQAIDVRRRPGVTHQMVDAALRRAGFLLVESIDEIDHSHFAFVPAGVAARVNRSGPVPVSAARPKPTEPRVAADLHGTLLVDSEAAIAVRPAPLPPPGSSPVLASAK
jgi:hypothetical protein